MLACVCQPSETALLFKGGPPVAMGPLGSNIKKQQRITEDISVQLLSKPFNQPNTELNGTSPSPTFFKSTSNLLNLRKIERKTKSTKILVNPVCSDSLGSSDESNRSKKMNSRWNGKKKRLKSDRTTSCNKSVDTETYNGEECRVVAREEKKSISCFKLKNSDDKSRTEEDQKSGKENCKNENSSNWKNLGSETPDIICDSQNSRHKSDGKTHEMRVEDQLDTDKTDSNKRCGNDEVSILLIYLY